MKRLPLDKMTVFCPQSHAVFLFLLNEAAISGRARIFTNRGKIGKAIGIKRVATISNALRALERSKLIVCRRKSKKQSNGSYAGGYLEIIIGNVAINALSVKLNCLGDVAKNATPAGGAHMGDEAKNATPSLKRVGAMPSATAAAPSPAKTFSPIQRAILEKTESANGVA